MKNRDYKQFGVGEYYHVYNRGNEKKDIFLDESDYEFFLLKLKQNLFPNEFKNHRTPPMPDKSFSLISYCLMPNHFHLLVKQNRNIPVTKLLARVCTSYVMYFNKKYKRIGGLFQDQYKMVLVDDNNYLVWLSAYIHQNPKVAGLTEELKDYQWSSYREYINGHTVICDTEVISSQFKSIQQYTDFVDESFEVIKSKKEIKHLLLDTG